MTRLTPASWMAAAALGLACAAALAQSPPRLQPGLWEHRIQMSSQSGEMEAAMKNAQAAMANMPAEQRKMMEQMMAKQGVAFDASGQSMRMCMTPEDVARDEIPAAQEGCTQTATRSGNTWTVSFRCPAHGTRETPGSVNVPVSVGDVIVHPGDLILGDLDGLMVVRRDDAARVLAACEEKTAALRRAATAMAGQQPRTFFDLIGGKDTIVRAGVEWVD